MRSSACFVRTSALSVSHGGSHLGHYPLPAVSIYRSGEGRGTLGTGGGGVSLVPGGGVWVAASASVAPEAAPRRTSTASLRGYTCRGRPTPPRFLWTRYDAPSRPTCNEGALDGAWPFEAAFWAAGWLILVRGHFDTCELTDQMGTQALNSEAGAVDQGT